MAKKTVYDLIKKQNGECFAKAIRNYDNGIFDVPGIVDIVKYAGRDAEPIMKYLVSLKDIHINEPDEVKDPFELLRSVGYDAVYADTLEKQNAIKPYFAPGEELCTFNDPLRFQNYYIMNVVHKDAAKLNRADFQKPQREDKYGTSVMSIQIHKSGGFISIKNRYNHMVQNSDNTYWSNPDNIVPGLSAALKKFFDCDFSSRTNLLTKGYVLMGGQILKYHVERFNIYYGADFVAHNGKICDIDKRHEIILDDTVWDIATRRRAEHHDTNLCTHVSAWTDVLTTAWAGKKIHVTKPEKYTTRITCDNGDYMDVRDGCVVALRLQDVAEVPSLFLGNATKLEKLDMPKLRIIGAGFLQYNNTLQELSLPEAIKVGGAFMNANTVITRFDAPKLKDIDDLFLCNNRNLAELNLPALESVGSMFLGRNLGLKTLSLPRLQTAGYGFLRANTDISEIYMPALESAGEDFLRQNTGLRRIDLPMLRYAENDFLMRNERICEINLPRLERIGDEFMYNNNALTDVCLPALRKIGDNPFACSLVIKRLSLPNLERLPQRMFMESESSLEYFYAPKIDNHNALGAMARDAWMRAIKANKER